MNILALASFSLILIVCVAAGIPTPYALLCGLIIFTAYAFLTGHPAGEIWEMMRSRFGLIRHMVIIFSMIGIMTAVWRACGTIQTIVCGAAGLLTPGTFLMTAFLINCVVSFLTGTSFGTAATFGVICMSIGHTLGADMVHLGGAVISGVFFGDRCSPVSSTALMVSMVTETDIHDNVKRMLRETAIPVIIVCVIYLVLGRSVTGAAVNTELVELIRNSYDTGAVTLLPAVIIVAASLLRIQIPVVILMSTVSAAVIAVTVQGMELMPLLKMCITGYETDAGALAPMINGGGLVSMGTCLIMVCFSSMYTGIFEGTGLLDPLKELLERAAGAVSTFFAVMTGTVAVIMLSCSQMLPVMLLADTVRGLEKNDSDAAMDFENSAITIAPLVPWTIASTVPLATIGVGKGALIFAFYLYMLPLYTLAVSILRNKKTGGTAPPDDDQLNNAE